MFDINEHIKSAMRAKDQLRVTVLRGLKTAIDNEAISLKKKDEGLTEEETVKVIKREANKRRDAAQAYRDGGREDQAAQEDQELKIVEEFLPEQMSEEDIAKVVDNVISETGATSAQDFGKVMGQVMAKLGSAADGGIVSKILKEKLSN